MELRLPPSCPNNGSVIFAPIDGGVIVSERTWAAFVVSTAAANPASRLTCRSWSGASTQKGERFLQEARARDISFSGALLSGLDADLRSGDVVGILYGKKKASYRVVWIRYDGAGDKMQVAVHRMRADECPGRELLPEDSKEQSSHPPSAPSPDV